MGSDHPSHISRTQRAVHRLVLLWAWVPETPNRSFSFGCQDGKFLQTLYLFLFPRLDHCRTMRECWRNSCRTDSRQNTTGFHLKFGLRTGSQKMRAPISCCWEMTSRVRPCWSLEPIRIAISALGWYTDFAWYDLETGCCRCLLVTVDVAVESEPCTPGKNPKKYQYMKTIATFGGMFAHRTCHVFCAWSWPLGWVPNIHQDEVNIATQFRCHFGTCFGF